jgi:hypothetical protein
MLIKFTLDGPLIEAYPLTPEQDNIVRKCLQKQANKRPSAEELSCFFNLLPHELLF